MIYLHHVLLDNPLLKAHLKVLRYCGLVLFDDQRFHFAHKFRGLLALLIWTGFTVAQFIDLFQIFGDVSKTTTNAAFTVLITTVLGQCYEFLYYRSDLMMILFNEIDKNMNKIRNFGGNSEKHKRNIANILARNVRNSNILTTVFWISSFFTVHMMCGFGIWKYLQVSGLSAEERIDANWLMIRSWYPVDIYENFIPIYIHQMINCYLGVTLAPLIYSLIVALMIYAIAMLQILKYCFETITDGIEDVRSMDDRDRILNQKLRDYVVTQLEIGRYVQNLDNLIRSSMFVIFAVFSVLLCSLLFQISMMEFSPGVIIPSIFIVNIIVILLTFYWYANEITVHSNGLPNAIYHCDWYMCSKKFNKLMLIFMVGTQRPLQLSAIYFTMNLDAFINLLKASYSYFTLLSHISDLD